MRNFASYAWLRECNRLSSFSIICPDIKRATFVTHRVHAGYFAFMDRADFPECSFRGGHIED